MIWTASTNRTRGTCGLEYLLAVPHAERGYLERLHGHGDDYSSLPVSSDASATAAVPCPILTSSPQPCILYEYHAADTAKQCHYSCSTRTPLTDRLCTYVPVMFCAVVFPMARRMWTSIISSSSTRLPGEDVPSQSCIGWIAHIALGLQFCPP